MKRPGPVGLVIGLAFAIPVILELRTVLSMIGIDVALDIYFVAMTVLLAVIVGLVMLLPEGEEENPSDSPPKHRAD